MATQRACDVWQSNGLVTCEQRVRVRRRVPALFGPALLHPPAGRELRLLALPPPRLLRLQRNVEDEHVIALIWGGERTG